MKRTVAHTCSRICVRKPKETDCVKDRFYTSTEPKILVNIVLELLPID